MPYIGTGQEKVSFLRGTNEKNIQHLPTAKTLFVDKISVLCMILNSNLCLLGNNLIFFSFKAHLYALSLKHEVFTT